MRELEDEKLNEEQVKELTKDNSSVFSKYITPIFEPVQTPWDEAQKLNADVFKSLMGALEQMANAPIEQDNYVMFANKSCFHAILEHNYFVIGTRLIVGSWMLNKTWKKLREQFHELFMNTNVDHAECYKTRNEALRAVARNRKGYVHEPINNPHTATVDGIDVIWNCSEEFKL